MKQNNSDKLYLNSLNIANICAGGGINNILCSGTHNKKHQECYFKGPLRENVLQSQLATEWYARIPKYIPVLSTRSRIMSRCVHTAAIVACNGLVVFKHQISV